MEPINGTKHYTQFEKYLASRDVPIEIADPDHIVRHSSIPNPMTTLTTYVYNDTDGYCQSFTSQSIVYAILSKLKSMAESYTGLNVTDAVITVPSLFDFKQRQIIKHAAQRANLNVLRIIDASTAAVIPKVFQNTTNANASAQNIVVYDLGGGTLDVSLVTIHDIFVEVLATAGDTWLGGKDFDESVVRYFIDLFKSKHCVDLNAKEHATSVTKLRQQVEIGKRWLYQNNDKYKNGFKYNITIPNITDTIDYNQVLTINLFEQINSDLFDRILNPLKQVLKHASLKPRDISEVLLIGGSTKITKIQQMIKHFFGKNTTETTNSINKTQMIASADNDNSVVFGAAILADVMFDALKHDIDIEDRLILLDIVPQSIGLAARDGKMVTIIKKYHPLEGGKTQEIASYSDRTVVRVYQGENTIANQNRYLGKVEIINALAMNPDGLRIFAIGWWTDTNYSVYLELPGHQENDVMVPSFEVVNGEIVPFRNQGRKVEVLDWKEKVFDWEKLQEVDQYTYSNDERLNEEKILNEMCDHDPALTRIVQLREKLKLSFVSLDNHLQEYLSQIVHENELKENWEANRLVKEKHIMIEICKSITELLDSTNCTAYESMI